MMKLTPRYSLPLYEDSDPQDLRDGYNRAILLLEQKINQQEIFIHETKGDNQ